MAPRCRPWRAGALRDGSAGTHAGQSNIADSALRDTLQYAGCARSIIPLFALPLLLRNFAHQYNIYEHT
eukprot:6185493-Pleurochrysis_carterae.AAC.4